MPRTTKAQLEAEIASLRRDIYTLVRKGDTEEGLGLKVRYELEFTIYDVAMGGSIHYDAAKGIITYLSEFQP